MLAIVEFQMRILQLYHLERSNTIHATTILVPFLFLPPSSLSFKVTMGLAKVYFTAIVFVLRCD